MDIKNKVVIVTGASGGIGLAAAKELAGRGARVVVAARSADTLAKLTKELPNSLAVPTDMTKLEEIRNLIEKTMEKYGRIDILVNNAGRGMYAPVENTNLNEYRDIMELNVYGPLLAMQEVIPVMRKQGGGTIVNVSSMVSKNHFPGLGAYASTKYALNALSFTAREELAKDNIAVCVVHPKMTATNFGENALGSRPDWNASGRPMPQIDPPEKVAESIAKIIESGEVELMV
jgi:NAD(P)-dependent dehydrogenase (short-subunit alcohol dehydrogenase family)